MGEELTIRFNDDADNEDIMTWMRRCFDELIRRLITDRIQTGEISLGDRVSLVINSCDGFAPIHFHSVVPTRLTVTLF